MLKIDPKTIQLLIEEARYRSDGDTSETPAILTNLLMEWLEENKWKLPNDYDLYQEAYNLLY